MREPRREEFRGGVPVALYRAVIPVTVKVSRAAEPQDFAAGEILACKGYPHPALSPLSWESVYAKWSGIRKTVRAEGLLPDAVTVAASLGRLNLSHVAACAHVERWMNNPQPIKES